MQNVQKNVSKNSEILQKFAVQRNADLKPCRARKMLKNAPTLAIGGADTAENEPPKVRQVSNKIRRNIGALVLWRCKPRDVQVRVPRAAQLLCIRVVRLW